MFGVMLVFRSRALDFLGQIWCVPAVLPHPVELHRPELEAGKEDLAGISSNKVHGVGCDLTIVCSSRFSFSPCLRGADGGRGQSGACGRVGLRRESDAVVSGRALSAAQVWLPTMMASRWPPLMPAMSPGVCSTSMRRPLEGLTMALFFFPVPSGSVPGTDEEGHGGGPLYCDSEGGPDCFSHDIFRVFLVKVRDCSVVFLFVKVLVVICTFTAVN